MILGTIRSVDGADTRKRVVLIGLESPWCWHAGVLSALAAPPFVLACLGGFEVGELELAYFPDPLLRRWREGRNTPVGRIDNQRCASTRMPARQEDPRVVRSGDVSFCASLPALVTEPGFRGTLVVQCGDFRVGEKLLVLILLGSLQRNLVVDGPD